MAKLWKTLLRVFNTVLTVLLAVIAVSNLYVLIAKKVMGKQNVTMLGFSSAIVITGSMSDTIEPNDMIITLKQKSYKVGDIITYEGASSTVTHRIVEITDEGYITKGDANNTADTEAVSKDKVVGKVMIILPRMGKVVAFLQSPLGMMLIMGLFLIALELPSIVGKLKPKGETENAENSCEDKESSGEAPD